MFHAEHTFLVILAHVCIATFYLVIGVRNLPLRANHAAKFAKMGVPWPRAFLALGFAFQFAGATMVLLDLYAGVGAALLIVFTLTANALYHRWWTMDDAAARRIHMNYFFNNVGNTGGLLLLIAGA